MTEYVAAISAPKVVGPAVVESQKYVSPLADLKTFGEARGLPAWTYFSERLTQLEHERVILPSWQFVCHVNELAAPGSYQTVEMMRDSFIVMRGHDGEIRAFKNVCRHRGARLLDGSGTCKGSIVCPYHGWTYRLDGSLRATPAKRTFPDLDLGQHGLIPVELEVFHGLVFLRGENQGGPSVAETWGELARYLAPYPITEWVPVAGGVQTLVWNCNWKTAVDNNLENYHIPIGHPGYDRLLAVDDHDEMNDKGLALSVAKVRPEASRNRTERFYQSLVPSAIRDLDPDASRTWLFATMQPNIGIDIYPDSMDVFQILPRTAETATLRYAIYHRASEKREIRVARYLNSRINRQVTLEDKELSERVQKGLATRGYQPGPLSTLEAGILDFHNRIRAVIPETRLASEPAGYAPQ